MAGSLAGLLLFASLLQLGTALQPDSLDASWLAVLAHASVHRWRPGTDIVFTYGPLGFLHPYLGYSPETFGIYALGRVAHAAVHAAIVLLAIRSLPRAPWIATVLFLVVASSLVKTDAIEFIGLLAGFSLLWALCERRDSRGVAAIGLIALLALVAFIKFTYLLVYALGIVFVVIELLVHRRWRAAGWMVSVGTATPAIVWMLVVGDPHALAPYLRWSAEIAAGYGPAMAMAGRHAWTVAGGALLVALLLTVASRRGNGASTSRALFVCITVFLVWKASFVRQDAGHMLVFYSVGAWVFAVHGWSARAAALRNAAGVLTMLAILGWFWTWGSLLDASSQVVDAFVADHRQNARALIGAYQREQQRRHADMQRTHRLDKIAAEVGRSSVDLFGATQGIVLLNELQYRPRPVFQPHMAYTPALARLNAAHLAAPNGPDYVIARLDPVDGRFPASEDPLALLQILLNHEPMFIENGFLLSRRSRGTHAHEVVDEHRLAIASAQWFEAPFTTVPDALALLRIEWHRPPLGTVLDLLWRPSTVVLETRDAHGAVRTYRLPIGSSEAGFVVSPAILSTEDLARPRGQWRQDPIVALRISVLGNRPAMLKPSPRVAWFTSIRSVDPGDAQGSLPRPRGG